MISQGLIDLLIFDIFPNYKIVDCSNLSVDLKILKKELVKFGLTVKLNGKMLELQ